MIYAVLLTILINGTFLISSLDASYIFLIFLKTLNFLFLLLLSGDADDVGFYCY